ncbi:hypothetical protein FQA39_LY13153 [Lamprigera yunnana]|nr:hypothetical protein FQA39_LY13153 [Lamprigera yunnana]
MSNSDKNLEEPYSASEDEWLPSDTDETPIESALSTTAFTSAGSSQGLEEIYAIEDKEASTAEERQQKRRQNRFIMEPVPDVAYKKFLKLKEQKLQNVKYLVRHIENKQDKKFDKLLNQKSEEVNDNQEPQSDFEDYE